MCVCAVRFNGVFCGFVLLVHYCPPYFYHLHHLLFFYHIYHFYNFDYYHFHYFFFFIIITISRYFDAANNNSSISISNAFHSEIEENENSLEINLDEAEDDEFFAFTANPR